jgi:hypothetical protein
VSAPHSFAPSFLASLLRHGVDRWEALGSFRVGAVLLAGLRGLTPTNNGKTTLNVGFELLLDQMSSYEANIPRIKAYVANFAAQVSEKHREILFFDTKKSCKKNGCFHF